MIGVTRCQTQPMRRISLLAAGVTLAMALGGCGSSKSPSTTGAGAPAGVGGGSCSPSGTALSISARDLKFDKGCLAAPADQAFTINFSNKEAGVPHNVTIEVAHTSTDALFTGDTVTGPTKTTYRVGALRAGTYHFHCTIHPELMQGAFVVQ